MNVLENILIKPIISEKSLRQVETLNQYSFVIDRKANKIEVAKVVKKLWKVEVLSVRIVHLRGKRVAFGKRRTKGSRSGIKKAIVTLKEGDKIDLFEIK